jgi:hypothetical protein
MLAALLTSSFATALVLTLAFPKTPTGRAIHRALVEVPALWLQTVTWAKLGKVVLLAVVFGIILSMGPEMLAILATMGGDAAAVELMIALWAAAVSGSLFAGRHVITRVVRPLLRGALAVMRPSRRRRAPRRQRRPRSKGGKSDPSSPEWAFA